MKRKVVMLSLLGGLTLGLWGCGSGGISAEAPAPTPAEDVGVPEETEAIQEVEGSDEVEARSDGPVKPEETEVADSGSAEAEVTDSETEPEAEDLTVSVDASALLTAYVVEYEDQDGYKIRETIQLSPIFTEDDTETMYALWEAMGNDVTDFPSEESLYNASSSMRYARDADSCDKLEYIIGIHTIENLTDGFPITPDNPYPYVGALHAKQVSTDDDEHDANAANSFNARSVSVAIYPDSVAYYSEQYAGMLVKSKMHSDVCEPVCFIIALPNGATPNRPDGYRYDKISMEFGNKAYADLGYHVFELTYFE